MGELFQKFLQNSKGNGGALLKVTFQLYTRKNLRDLRVRARKFLDTTRRFWSQNFRVLHLGNSASEVLRERVRRHISQIVLRLDCELGFKDLRE